MKTSDKYYHTEASVKEYIRLAKGVNGKALIEQLKQHLPKGSSLLELGSGPGSDYQLLQDVYDVVGSDFSLQFIDHLQKRFPSGNFLHLDASNLEIDANYDGIYSNKVLHHLSDDQLKASIQQQAEILNIGGCICHSFWRGEGSETFKGMFVNYHSADELQKLFAPFFDLIVLDTYQEFETDDSLLLIAKLK